MGVVNKIVLVIGMYCFAMIAVNAQTTLNLYPLNGTIGVRFFSEKKISLEPRVDFQFDHADGQSNLFINTELFTLINFSREERFNFYTGVGLGANIYNQASSSFSGTLPLGARYYINDSKRIAIIGECGMKVTALDFVKIKSYALIGVQIRFKKS
ncbi:MAG: hypothetical protein H7259_04960 [Cytophagales bacterium]|nr:hypothetical protein [Cytophaga sp.]